MSFFKGIFSVREFKFLYAFALATVIAASLGACTGDQVTKSAAAETYVPEHPSLTGSYLIGRFAQRQRDWDTAQKYMSIALSYDSSNVEMIQRTFLLALGSGNFASAKALAEKLVAMKKDGTEMAVIFLTCDAISHDDFKSAQAYLDRLPTEGFGQYTKPLLTAWSLMGQGNKEAALKLLASNTVPDDPAYQMHAGMMEEMSGNDAGAAEHYKVAMASGLSLHTAMLVANFFARTGKPEISHDIYKGLDKLYPYNPFLAAAMNDASKKHTYVPNITHAADGAALALFDLATLLYEKRAYDSAQIYGSLVQELSPASPFAHMMIGDIAALHEQYDKSLAQYGAIGAASPFHWIAQARMTEVYEASGKIDQAAAIYKPLMADPATRVPALASLGDIYRRQGRYADAVKAYDDALAGASPVNEAQWPIVYARGMAEERLDRWPEAEKDLLQALSYQPENPAILNFLAYSWADKGVNLNKALEYAKHAVALKPNDGYILDSYGWTLFRLSQYKESVNWLEQAVAQIPDDSTLLDHLGDAYWQAGRHDEARYQWKHARDMSRDDVFKKTAEQKIEHGITVPNQVSSNIISIQ